MYHLSWGAVPAPPSPLWASWAGLSIDQLRDLRPDEVEGAEDQGGDDRHADDDESGRADLLGGGPRHLLELGRDLDGEAVDAIVAVQGDASDQGDERGDGRDEELVRRRAQRAPDPVGGPLEDVEEQQATTQ